ncbi:hypothetical protein EJ05DRAFT_542484 [Pseudovirgaria hyperparasitica]|uniref:Uncharacterized protein n=1 Tax=Pseudovirgaria hyperparasitica TaxID=470096 RepID=A0A6A6VPV1_9PEZI|nr:uncharacterized protein EJ05DRAFT_542484 [Pseudovirgaria hyperparasitica]KAF2752668.1 hypothetical protein EJ05DRAFT_542484 [Pseudovirgaria hyperparasitica]
MENRIANEAEVSLSKRTSCMSKPIQSPRLELVPILGDYPLKIEEERGILRIYGRGEGLTHEDKAQQVDNQRDITIVLYSAQIQLRKILNQVPMYLFPLWNHPPHNFPAGVYEPPFGREASTGIPSFLNWLYNWLNVSKAMGVDWDDYNDPSPDLNITRLRAKYYGAETIITRPYLHYEYHCPEADRDVPSMELHQISKRELDGFKVMLACGP